MPAYTTTVLAFGSGTGIEVPPEVLEELGAGKRPTLDVTVGSHSWTTTVGAMGGRTLISVSRALRAATGVAAGEEVEVRVEVATAPREVEVPAALQEALAAAGKQEAFAALSYSARKEHARQVAEAKAEATRERRVQKVLDALG